VFDPVSQNAIVNVPSARIYGAELETDAQVGPLTLNAGFAYTQSRINQQLSLIDSRNPFAGPQDVTGTATSLRSQVDGERGVDLHGTHQHRKVTATAQYSYKPAGPMRRCSKRCPSTCLEATR